MNSVLQRVGLVSAVTLLLVSAAFAGAIKPAPPRRPGEGLGPFHTLLIRGATLIDGTGAPPVGPVDIVIKDNRISEIRESARPGASASSVGPQPKADYEIDATGQYVLPGFIDMHTHGGDAEKAPDLSYVYKLWMAHGVTTVRRASGVWRQSTGRQRENQERAQ